MAQAVTTNGAGKSITIQMLTGILHPTAGEAVIGGLMPQRERTRNSKWAIRHYQSTGS